MVSNLRQKNWFFYFKIFIILFQSLIFMIIIYFISYILIKSFLSGSLNEYNVISKYLGFNWIKKNLKQNLGLSQNYRFD